MNVSPENLPPEQPVGPSIGIAIVVLIFIFGGIYFLLVENERFHRQPIEQNVSV